MASAANIARIVQLNGGSVVGKTRLQKTAYFLEALGVGFGFDFDYHHYGPYSEELANLAEDARALGMLDIEWRLSQEGAKYAVFLDRDETIGANEIAGVDASRQKVLNVLSNFSALELELAATADYLAKNGYADEAWNETKLRKASKISEDRIARSKQLLQELHDVMH